MEKTEIGVGSAVASLLAVNLGMAIGCSGVVLVAAASYVVGALALLGVLRGAVSAAQSP